MSHDLVRDTEESRYLYRWSSSYVHSSYGRSMFGSLCFTDEANRRVYRIYLKPYRSAKPGPSTFIPILILRRRSGFRRFLFATIIIQWYCGLGINNCTCNLNCDKFLKFAIENTILLTVLRHAMRRDSFIRIGVFSFTTKYL